MCLLHTISTPSWVTGVHLKDGLCLVCCSEFSAVTEIIFLNLKFSSFMTYKISTSFMCYPILLLKDHVPYLVLRLPERECDTINTSNLFLQLILADWKSNIRVFDFSCSTESQVAPLPSPPAQPISLETRLQRYPNSVLAKRHIDMKPGV